MKITYIRGHLKTTRINAIKQALDSFGTTYLEIECHTTAKAIRKLVSQTNCQIVIIDECTKKQLGILQELNDLDLVVYVAVQWGSQS